METLVDLVEMDMMESYENDTFYEDDNYTADGNSSTYSSGSDFPTSLQALATVLHVSIFLLGVPGNILLIIVARRTRSLQTPTYCYLTSLAFADLLVLFSAVPEAVVFVHVGRRWVAGQIGCSLFVFTNFLGINTGSISILAFTLERYVAIVATPFVQNFCTTERTKKIIIAIWITMILYCSPWLGLTEVKPDPDYPDGEICDFRFSSQVYTYMFAIDFALFYIFPLSVAGFVYSRIWLVLCKSSRLFTDCDSSGNVRIPSYNDFESCRLSTRRDVGKSKEPLSGRPKKKTVQSTSIMQTRVQVLPMLMVTVCFFAIAWLPFRGLLIYNSVVSEPWLDVWYLLFAKTMVYLNSAINPFLYNVMSRRFRVAVRRVLSCRKKNPSRNRSGMRFTPPPLPPAAFYRRPYLASTFSDPASFPLRP